MKKLIYLLPCLLLAGCASYSTYQRPQVETAGLFEQTDTASIASIPWREFFADAKLQALIDSGLKRNTDLNVARLRVEAAEAALAGAKRAFLPSVSANGEVGASPASYNLGATASWELDLSGRLTAAKREARAALEASHDYRQAVQTGLIATIAASYYTLAMLDNQLKINAEAIESWQNTVRTLEALMKVGRANDTGVLQAKAAVLSLENSRLELQKSIAETEHALCALLAMPSQSIARNSLSEATLSSTKVAVGIPAQLLANRPDVRQAEMELAQAFYATNTARAAFYPTLTLSGTLGWTNNSGGVTVNPAQWIANAIASVTQPLLSRGANTANLKIAQARQAEAQLRFQQSLFDAGKEVNDALTALQTADAQLKIDAQRIYQLAEALRKTELLMRHSSLSYLEVLTAQQTLLDARLSQTTSSFNRLSSLITLYRTLGGGTH